MQNYPYEIVGYIKIIGKVQYAMTRILPIFMKAFVDFRCN